MSTDGKTTEGDRECFAALGSFSLNSVGDLFSFKYRTVRLKRSRVRRCLAMGFHLFISEDAKGDKWQEGRYCSG